MFARLAVNLHIKHKVKNIASNQDITLQSEIQHLTQPVHDIYPDLSLGSVPDQSSISRATRPRRVLKLLRERRCWLIVGMKR